MDVLHFVIFGYVFTTAIITGQAILNSSSQTDGSLPDNFIGFDLAPDKVVGGSMVHVQYQCSKPCQLTVEVVVSTVRKTDLVVFRRKWISGTPQVYRVHQVLLSLPPSILYQQDFFNRRVLDAHNATVRAWLGHLNGGSEPVTYQSSILRIYKALQIKSLSERPTKPPTECPSWSAHLMWQMTRNRIYHCPHESEITDMLKFPLASTGERFGVVRRFQPFIDRALERRRLHAVTQPSVTLSVWIYPLKWCHEKLCGIIHHVDRRNLYDSVMMHLTDKGHVIIQARVTTGEDEAFQTTVALPLRKWIRLDCYIQHSKFCVAPLLLRCVISFWNSCRILKDGSSPAGKLQAIAVLLDTTWDGEKHRYVYEFQGSIHYDDTDGYFVIGGSKYLPGIHGYFGPIKYYRFGTKEVKNQLHPKSLQEVDKTHQECQEIKAFTKDFFHKVAESYLLSPVNRDVCTSHLWGQFGGKKCTQTWNWENQLKYSTFFHFLQTNEEKIRTGSLEMTDLRSILFEQAVGEMFTVNQLQSKITSKSMALLQVASCFGNHKASLLLATLHFSGLEHSVDLQQGHVYSLIAAAGDNRFALMHAGYKHTQGIDGFPKDLDMAYSYYSNIGAQSNIDSLRIHEDKQYRTEHIYLSNPEDLNRVKRDVADAFHYFKYLAERGDLESQKHLARMLYWGHHRVPKDTVSAVKWFERTAVQMKDPSAMYDYSILLIKGHGVKRNYTRGFRLLEKAAAMGSINALNGLGWYHAIILKDHKKAVKCFEQAALNGSDDAMYNLGIYHLSGENPDSPWVNETAAFQQFLNASQSCHVAASVEAAWYLSTGCLEGVSQDVERAVIMLKKVCEQNGHLGFMIREALQAYLQGSWKEAFVSYLLAAESGLGSAQTNVAHLCEELHLSHDCQWRYHNYSILNYDPHPSALLKMGDYYYRSSSTREDSLSVVGQAISMYGRAALAGSPQGMYNLAVLAHEGHVLPLSVGALFNVSHRDERDIVVEKILERCVESKDEEAVTPCSLTLLGLQMGKALRRMTQNGAQLLLVYASLLSVFVVIVIVPVQSCLEQKVPRHHAVALRARTSPVSQDGVNLNRGQDGIVAGTDRAAGNLRLTILNGEQWLRQACDLAVTLSGVCLCAFWTTLLYHLL